MFPCTDIILVLALFDAKTFISELVDATWLTSQKYSEQYAEIREEQLENIIKKNTSPVVDALHKTGPMFTEL